MKKQKPISPYKPRPGSYLSMVLPDIHFPLHDRHALACVLGCIRLLCPSEIGYLGDVMDLGQFSQWGRSTRLEDRAESFYKLEVAPTRALLAFGEIYCDRQWLLEGNHEFRMERWIVRNGDGGRALADLVSPRLLLQEGRNKPFTYIDYTAKPTAPLPHYKVAKGLVAVHGWSYCKHVAAKHLEIARNHSVIHGHTHRRQHHTVRQPIDNLILEAWSPGTLAQLQPIYMAHTPTDAVHGFDLIWVTEDKERWTHYSVLIIDGVCILPDGRKVDGRDYMKILERIEQGVGA